MNKSDVLILVASLFSKYAPENTPTDEQIEAVWKEVSKSQKPSTALQKDYDPLAKDMARLLQKFVIENYPYWMKGFSLEKKTRIMRETADAIEKINRIDKFDYGTIEVVIRWSQQDSFWKKNIRSGNKLRDHFRTLLAEVQAHVEEKQEQTIGEV